MNVDYFDFANDACAFLEQQKDRLTAAKTCEEAEKIMQEVSDYPFHQMNINLLYDTPIVRCIKINKDEKCHQSITKIERFSYPPVDCVTEPGRMNIPNEPIFYAANDIETALLESSIKEGDEFYAGIWKVSDSTRMSLYPCIPYDTICKLSDSGDSKASEMKKRIDSHPCIRKMAELIGNIFSIPHGTDNPSAINNNIYYLSGAIAHSILNQQKITKDKIIYQTDAIIYPSVKESGRSFNLAIRPQFVDQHMKLLYVVKGKLKEGRLEFSFRYVGFNENGTVVWKQMHKDLKELKVTKIINNQGIHSPVSGENLHYKGFNFTISEFENFIRINPDPQIKNHYYSKDHDIIIMNPNWIRKWEGCANEELVLSVNDVTKVQILANIDSSFTTEGVSIEKVWEYCTN